jgi:hypothetical protein
MFVHISYSYFSLTGYFYFRRVVRNDSRVRRLRRQRSRPCAVRVPHGVCLEEYGPLPNTVRVRVFCFEAPGSSPLRGHSPCGCQGRQTRNPHLDNQSPMQSLSLPRQPIPRLYFQGLAWAPNCFLWTPLASPGFQALRSEGAIHAGV